MTIRCIDDLIDVLRDTSLVSGSQLDAVVMALRSGFVEAADLAEDLVLKRWLTLYQAKEIFRGRGRALVLGQYVVLDRLGAGGMAVVFKAHHRHLERTDALKVLRPDRLADPRVRSCFLQEAEAAARLGHPNVVRVYDAGEEAGRCFLAMEYVDGTDLASLVSEQGPLSVRRTCQYLAQAARGLHHAHERGLVHRDVKPSNLLLSADRSLVKVVDLGMALLPRPMRKRDAVGSGRTVMGTPDYLAPEQAADPWQVDARADIYALGCTLYYLLAGRPPFPSGSAEEKIRRHLSARPVPLERLRKDLPPTMVELTRAMLAKNPHERPQSLREVVERLEGCP